MTSVSKSLTGSASRHEYGYQWYRTSYQLPYGELVVHAAYGRGGQRIWVVPELALTAVQTAGNYDDWKAGYQAERLLLERIVPWALGIEAAYGHQLSRPTLNVESGEWPFIALSGEERARYVGVYDQAGDLLEVSDEGGVLQLTLPGSGVVHLIPEENRIFVAGIMKDGQPRKIFWPSERLVFVLDDEGEVLRFEWTEDATGEVSLLGRRKLPASD